MRLPDKRFGYFHASKGQFLEKLPFARINRSNMTEAEARLWSRLRKRQLDGNKFRRQDIIDKYIVDFTCLEKHLVVEVDGGYHLDPEQKKKDATREEDLLALRFRVLRFTNEEVLNDIDSVVEVIRRALSDPSPGPVPSR
ncbi:MAG: endonuclease domain-containing protein [Chitinophagaceae bacterium]|nr:MAG: endonuclease domain-containing protein [Chitinophagaceae bacterium]